MPEPRNETERFLYKIEGRADFGLSVNVVKLVFSSLTRLLMSGNVH